MQRPASLPGHLLHRFHVHLIDIGTLLPVDLEANEMGVHEGGRFLVFESLMLHHVAPMACAVTHTDEHEFSCVLCFPPSIGAPRPPMDRIVLVL